MNFKTAFPAQVIGQNGFTAVPLVTIGEIIPDTTGALNSSTEGDYQPVGILDGVGAIQIDEDTIRAFVNHELVDQAGVPYQVFDANGNPFTLTGGRISYFDINSESFVIEDAGIAYNRIFDANGNIASDNAIFGQVFIDPSDQNLGLRDVEGFSRFCSGGLNEAEQFGPSRGLTDDIYFAGEEVGGFFNSVGGANWALDVATGDIYQLPALGRGSWENTSEIDTGTTTHVAFILADDQSPFDFDGDGEVEGAPFYLYVGEKNLDSDNFLERNGLADGNLYVWVPDANADENPDNDILNALQFNGAGTTATGAWVQIDNSAKPENASLDGSTGFDQFGYPTQGNLITQAEAVGAFVISRPEDVATNPNNPSEIVQAVTGVDTFAIGPDGNGADTFGALYTLDTDFSNLTSSGALTATATVIYDGDQDPNRSLRSPDNLDWSADGFIYVQEDEAEEDSLTGEFLFGQGAANPNEASIVRVDPNATPEEASVGDNVTTIGIVDRSQILDPTVPDPTTAVDEDFERTEDGIFGPGEIQLADGTILDAGEWETSGIVDVSSLFGEESGSVFLFDVQAHGLADQDQENLEQGDLSALTDDNLSEGGQLVILVNSDSIIVGTPDDDVLTGDSDDNSIRGLGGDDEILGESGDDSLSGGQGDDEIIGGSGDDSLSGGEGDDEIIGESGDDTLSGGEGDDEIIGESGDDNISGGEGDDEIIGGSGDDSLSGGEGNDEIIGESGDDLISGDEGEDELIGESGDDTISGGSGDDILEGGSGDDILSGGGGSDQLDGGRGNDTADFSDLSFGVAADLSEGTAIYEPAPGVVVEDTLDDIENLTGTNFNDQLIGDDGVNVINGFGGVDELTGGAAGDIFVLGDQSGAFYAETGTADVADIIDFVTGEDQIQLHGDISDYSFFTFGNTSFQIALDTNGNGDFDFIGDDIIAFVGNGFEASDLNFV